MKRHFGMKLNKVKCGTLALVFVLLLSGCGKKESIITETVIDQVDSKISDGRGITVYRVENRTVVASDEKFQPKQPDSVAVSLEETMAILPLVDGVKFMGYSMSENNAVTLQFEVADSVSRESLLLGKAAVISTLEQIPEIGVMTISVQNEAGKVLDEESYGKNSFYYYDDVIPTGQNTGQIRLCIPNEKRDALEDNYLMVTLQSDVSVEEEVVRQLLDRGAFRGETQLISISVTQGVAYVDLTDHFETDADEMAVYSLVNSLCALPHIKSVLILIEGEKRDLIGGVDTHVPLGYTTK